MKPADQNEVRNSLLTFTRFMFVARKGRPMKDNWHIASVCHALELVVLGETNRLIINVPPRSGKTDVAVKSFMAWCMGLWPQSEFIHASYSKRLATSNTYAVRAMMQHRAYLDAFPWTAIQDDSRAKDEFRTQQGGIVYATGAEGTITGYGAGGMNGDFAGAIIIDDPHKAGEGESDVQRQNVIDWFQETMESRKNSPDTPIILIMQRLHENDLTGWLLGGGNGEHWDCLKVPARDESGASFWPDQFPAEMLDRLEQANPYVFAGQYMQEPSPRSGGMFKPGMIEIVDALPAGLKFTRGWDLAASKNAGDWTAGAKLAVKDGITYITDVVRERGGPDDVERLVVQTAQTDGVAFQSLPQDPGQAGKAQAAYLSKKLQGRSFEFTPETGDKATRASPFAAQVNAGNVKMLRADWNAALIHEMRTFPMGKNDDQIDALSRAYNRATSARSGGMRQIQGLA